MLLHELLLIGDLDGLPRSKVELVIDTFALTALVEVLWLISDISIALELIAHIIAIIVTKAAAILSNLGLLEPKLVLEGDLAQRCQDRGNTLTISALELVRWHVKRDAQLLKLQHHVL